jgi:hypothetical protein
MCATHRVCVFAQRAGKTTEDVLHTAGWPARVRDKPRARRAALLRALTHTRPVLTQSRSVAAKHVDTAVRQGNNTPCQHMTQAKQSDSFSLRVAVRVMRIRNALPAHLPCTATKADTTWSLCRIKNAEQCVAEIVSVASVMPRGGDGREVCDPGMACVTHFPLVV